MSRPALCPSLGRFPPPCFYGISSFLLALAALLRFLPQAPFIRWFLGFSDLLLVTSLCFLARAAALVFLAGERVACLGTWLFIFKRFPFPLHVFFLMPNR